jgi:hypothetical protein
MYSSPWYIPKLTIPDIANFASIILVIFSGGVIINPTSLVYNLLHGITISTCNELSPTLAGAICSKKEIPKIMSFVGINRNDIRIKNKISKAPLTEIRKFNIL